MTHDDIAEDLANGLPYGLPRSPSDGNYHLLEAVATQLDEHNRDIRELDARTTLQGKLAPDRTIPSDESDTIADGETVYYDDLTVDGTLTVRGRLVARDITINGELDVEGGTVETGDEFIIDRLHEFGKLVSAPPREGESPEHYRARLLVRFGALSSEATISSVLGAVSRILDTDKPNIGYDEPAGGEHGTVQITLPGEAIDESALSESEIANMMNRIVAASYRVNALRSGTFTYITPDDYDLDNHDSTLGYDGLDANGDPNDNGGTYAGTI